MHRARVLLSGPSARSVRTHPDTLQRRDPTRHIPCIQACTPCYESTVSLFRSARIPIPAGGVIRGWSNPRLDYSTRGSEAAGGGGELLRAAHCVEAVTVGEGGRPRPSESLAASGGAKAGDRSYPGRMRGVVEDLGAHVRVALGLGDRGRNTSVPHRSPRPRGATRFPCCCCVLRTGKTQQANP